MLLQSVSGITNCNRLLLQSASGIAKCDSYYKVRRNNGAALKNCGDEGGLFLEIFID